MISWESAFKRFEKAKSHGFSFQFDNNSKSDFYVKEQYKNGTDYGFHFIKNKNYQSLFTAKNGSHDDGPLNGPFLGGIGTSNFSRDFTGLFNRWHLQQGVHHNEAIESAFFMLHWKIGEINNYKRIQIGGKNFKENEMEYASLFPFVYEYYRSPELPFELLMEYYSPTIPHNYKDSSLPITCFNFYFKPKINENIEVSVGLIWPNLLGWQLPYKATEARQAKQWPHHHNSGNSSKFIETKESTCHIKQFKDKPLPHKNDMEGNILMSIEGGGNWGVSYHSCFRANQITTGIKDEKQKATISYVEEYFKNEGDLSNDNINWNAHWHEPLASALAGKTTLSPHKDEHLLITLTMDMPITAFGLGRKWYKAYTQYFGEKYDSSTQMANYAVKQNQHWLKEISDFHRNKFNESSYLPNKVKGAQINELYFIVGGGTVWVTKPVEGYEGDNEIFKSVCHFGLLEGFDTGYYYYNTLDLWVYSFVALSKNWPKLSNKIFTDFLVSVNFQDKRKHMVYRTGTLEENLIFEKLPHDMGSAPEDPWVQLNGYTHRDNPNLWKDHNPSFVIAYYLHKQLISSEFTQKEYNILVQVMNFTDVQDNNNIGTPKHTDFGDSTWDNIDMKGISSYTTGLCIGAWSVMKKLAEEFDEEKAIYYKSKLLKAQKTMEKLWNGKYYYTNDTGKYSRATMSEALFGVYIAKKAGLGDLLPYKNVVSHLKAIFHNNLMTYSDGNYGSLLISEEKRQYFEGDGGESIQVNEVIVGSSWVFAAMLYEYELYQEAEYLSNTLRDMVYKNTGFQFRTPAAWDNQGQFRAPLNMRPLSLWML